MDTEPEIAWHDLSAEQREAVLNRLTDALARVTGVRLVVAHGSLLRAGSFRDVDVAVLFEEPFTWRNLGQLEDAALAALKPWRLAIDVAPLNDAPPHFRARVVETGRVLFERAPGDALDFWVRARSERIDLAAWRRARGLG